MYSPIHLFWYGLATLVLLVATLALAKSKDEKQKKLLKKVLAVLVIVILLGVFMPKLVLGI